VLLISSRLATNCCFQFSLREFSKEPLTHGALNVGVSEKTVKHLRVFLQAT